MFFVFSKVFLRFLCLSNTHQNLTCHLGTLSRVLASVRKATHCITSFPGPTPIPHLTKVLLDHIEIDPVNKELLIFCKVTDNNWLVNNIVGWKGYTIIAVTGLYGSPNINSWSFRGTGKLSMIGKNVSLLISDEKYVYLK